MRRTNNLKNQRRMVISALLVICVLLVGAIYLRINPNTAVEDNIAKEDLREDTVEVAEITGLAEEAKENYNKHEENTNTVEVAKIELEQTSENPSNKVEKVVINEPMPVVPDKPENKPPTHTPQTNSDLGNPDEKPVYAEEEVVYVPEPVEESQTVEETTSSGENQQAANNGESGLVPDSENPFLQANIPDNSFLGISGGVKFEDITDYVPGTGEKF
ncbi:MAG: DUF6550 family protein [Alkaliphilus sp.]